MENRNIRRAIRESGHYQWEVAELLGISEGLFSRWLRRELPEEKKQKILQVVAKLKEDK